MGVGGTHGMDRAHVGSPGNRGGGRQMVQTDRQSVGAEESGKSAGKGGGERRQRRDRWAERSGNGKAQGKRKRGYATGTGRAELPSAGGQAGMDRETREQGKATAGSPGGARSDRARRTAPCDRTDLRARICSAE